MPRIENLLTIGGRLYSARRAAKLTQKALAKKSGVPQPVISDLETGKQAGTSYAVALALAVNVSPAWLAENRGPRTASVDTDEGAFLEVYRVLGETYRGQLFTVAQRMREIEQLMAVRPPPLALPAPRPATNARLSRKKGAGPSTEAA